MFGLSSVIFVFFVVKMPLIEFKGNVTDIYEKITVNTDITGSQEIS